MGSQLTSSFNIEEQSLTAGGPSDLWKVYRGSKKTNEVPISLFVLEKDRVEKEFRASKEEVFAAVRKEVKTLAKLRHPSILNITEPLEEDSKLMCFATEPVEGSLKYILDNHTKFSILPSELELKTQILELIDALVFLHNNARLLHLAVSPENIYLTPQGRFKIAGFFFSLPLPDSSSYVSPNITASMRFRPSYSFVAPEVVRRNEAGSKSDAFGVGALIYSLLSAEKSGKSSHFLSLSGSPSESAYRNEIERMSKSQVASKLSQFAGDACNLLEGLLEFDPNVRLSLQDASNYPWFNDPRIKTLEYLEHLNEKEHQHKLQFLNGLANVLGEFDSKVLLKRILPKLASYLVIDKLSAFVLPPIISILEREQLCSMADFYNAVWPHMEQMCKGREIPAQTLFLIVKNTSIWIRLVSMQDFQSTVLVLYQKGIDCGVSKIQECVVDVIPMFAKKIEYATLKSMLLSRVLKTAITSSGKLKIKCVESIANFAVLLDRAVIREAVFPTLEKITKTDTSSQFHLAMVKTIESFLKTFTYEELASKVIPLLLSIAVTGQFTKRQFSEIMALIRKLIDKVDDSRGKELQDIAASSKEIVEDEPKKQKQDPGDADVFNFLNQLGSSSKKSATTPVKNKAEEAKAESAQMGFSTNNQSTDWDLIFDRTKQEKTKPKKSIPLHESKPNKSAILPEPKPKTTKQSNLDLVDLLEPESKPVTSPLAGIYWDTAFGSSYAGGTSGAKQNKGKFADLTENPFAELEAGVEDVSSKPKIQAYKPSFTQKKPDSDIDDFFNELSASKK
eukprot:TRINITY_DN10766_c0_g1_i4.p1 TRINITY_DN10766_c0_g1~~TRINITY_DN10766_c0_g1_i4.p1  ORF type:complete len:799 (-),score=205.15 TRINITY_DN10766_c0_g1_i4:155-2530(-)